MGTAQNIDNEFKTDLVAMDKRSDEGKRASYTELWYGEKRIIGRRKERRNK